MPTKLDIMRNTGQNWVLIDGKVKRVEEFIKPEVVSVEEEKKELEEKLKKVKPKKSIKKKRKKKK